VSSALVAGWETDVHLCDRRLKAQGIETNAINGNPAGLQPGNEMVDRPSAVALPLCWDRSARDANTVSRKDPRFISVSLTSLPNRLVSRSP
jgi:hypothetical protein